MLKRKNALTDKENNSGIKFPRSITESRFDKKIDRYEVLNNELHNIIQKIHLQFNIESFSSLPKEKIKEITIVSQNILQFFF